MIVFLQLFEFYKRNDFFEDRKYDCLDRRLWNLIGVQGREFIVFCIGIFVFGVKFFNRC